MLRNDRIQLLLFAESDLVFRTVSFAIVNETGTVFHNETIIIGNMYIFFLPVASRLTFGVELRY